MGFPKGFLRGLLKLPKRDLRAEVIWSDSKRGSEGSARFFLFTETCVTESGKVVDGRGAKP